MSNFLTRFASVFVTDISALALSGGSGGVAALIVGFIGAPVFGFIYGTANMSMAPLPLLQQLGSPQNVLSTFIVGALISIFAVAVSRAVLG